MSEKEIKPIIERWKFMLKQAMINKDPNRTSLCQTGLNDLKALSTPAPVSVKTEQDENLVAEIIKKHIPNGIQNIKAIGKGNGKPQYKAEIDVIATCMKEYASSLPPAPVKPVGDVMRWVKASECPIESGEYFIKFTTGQYRGQKSTAYYSRKGNIWMWSIQGGFVEDSHLLEWLEENVKPVEGETITGVEEAAKDFEKRYAALYPSQGLDFDSDYIRNSFIEGAKWQAQQAKQPNQ